MGCYPASQGPSLTSIRFLFPLRCHFSTPATRTPPIAITRNPAQTHHPPRVTIPVTHNYLFTACGKTCGSGTALRPSDHPHPAILSRAHSAVVTHAELSLNQTQIRLPFRSFFQGAEAMGTSLSQRRRDQPDRPQYAHDETRPSRPPSNAALAAA
jgi:hypothetical protein